MTDSFSLQSAIAVAQMSSTQQDQYWMKYAISLAQRGLYTTRPNPNVGCVIVKDNVLIGEGFHPKAGQAHAEVFALRQAGAAVQGATAYVTLEPCAHYGRTPPCALALSQSGVSRVVIACLDPNPLVAGKGIDILIQAGIQVEHGICEEEAAALNRGFLKSMAGTKPYVRLKMASSLDGRTAMASGESKWITGAEARLDVQHWRAMSAAVITGVDTVLADDCELNVRDIPAYVVQAQAELIQPIRIVLDRQGRMPLTAKMLLQPDTVMVMGPFRQDLADLGVLQLPIMTLADLLVYLRQNYQFFDLMVEAGATLSTAFLQQNLVDELISYVAPTFLGQSARSMFAGQFTSMSEQLRFKLIDVAQVGNDLRLRLIPTQETI